MPNFSTAAKPFLTGSLIEANFSAFNNLSGINFLILSGLNQPILLPTAIAPTATAAVATNAATVFKNL